MLKYKKINRKEESMAIYEAPRSVGSETRTLSTSVCGINCNWGFGTGIVIAMVGPLPGPT